MKARLNAVSAVTGLAQWRVIVEAINCFVHDLPPQDRELVDGLSARLVRFQRRDWSAMAPGYLPSFVSTGMTLTESVSVAGLAGFT